MAVFFQDNFTGFEVESTDDFRRHPQIRSVKLGRPEGRAGKGETCWPSPFNLNGETKKKLGDKEKKTDRKRHFSTSSIPSNQRPEPLHTSSNALHEKRGTKIKENVEREGG